MRVPFFAMTAAVVIASCAPDTAEQQTAALDGCSASASRSWQPPRAAEFSIEATSSGPTCERAVATIVVRNAQGAIQWAEAYAAEQVMVLAHARYAATMQTALAGWIAPDNHAMATSSALPEWPRDAPQPVSAEFPFHPEAELDRGAYDALRTRNVPMFCYVQGMESQVCLALDNGELIKVGVQNIPG